MSGKERLRRGGADVGSGSFNEGVMQCNLQHSNNRPQLIGRYE